LLSYNPIHTIYTRSPFFPSTQNMHYFKAFPQTPFAMPSKMSSINTRKLIISLSSSFTVAVQSFNGARRKQFERRAGHPFFSRNSFASFTFVARYGLPPRSGWFNIINVRWFLRIRSLVSCRSLLNLLATSSDILLQPK
jgi:hypothetical protein